MDVARRGGGLGKRCGFGSTGWSCGWLGLGGNLVPLVCMVLKASPRRHLGVQALDLRLDKLPALGA
jgi:hypothetical protein